MKKKILVLILSLLIVLLCSCGKAEYDSNSLVQSYSEKSVASYEGTNSASKISTDTDSSSVDVSIGRKLVYTSDLNIQTLKFDETINSIRELVSTFDGYFESSRQNNGENYYYESTYSGGYENSGSYVIRIPNDKYSDFISNLNENYHVVSISEDIDDISDNYYEVTSHIETIKIKISRLQTLLKQAKSMSDIIEIEDALSDCEYELEQYTNTLNRYDGMVNYATINLALREVRNYEAVDSNFFETLWENISGGVLNFISGLENFVYWIGYNLIIILVLVVLIILSIKKKWFKRLKEKRELKKESRKNSKINYEYVGEKKENK